MAETEDWVAPTIAAISATVTMPESSTRYLKRPPVSFVHFIICQVLQATGFAEGLYSQAELQSNYLTDRETRWRFLQKAIQCIEHLVDEEIEISVSKILAGQEAEKTCAFLRVFHQAATTCSRDDSAVAVAYVQAWEASPQAQMGESRRRKSGPRSPTTAGLQKSQSRKRLDDALDAAEAIGTGCFPVTPSRSAAFARISVNSSVADEGGIAITGGTSEELGPLVRGKYVISGTNHGKPAYRKVGEVGISAWVFYWDESDGPEYHGWWASEYVGADFAWCFNPSNAEEPPPDGWRMPWNGDVDPSFRVVRLGVLVVGEVPASPTSDGAASLLRNGAAEGNRRPSSPPAPRASTVRTSSDGGQGVPAAAEEDEESVDGAVAQRGVGVLASGVAAHGGAGRPVSAGRRRATVPEPSRAAASPEPPRRSSARAASPPWLDPQRPGDSDGAGDVAGGVERKRESEQEEGRQRGSLAQQPRRSLQADARPREVRLRGEPQAADELGDEVGEQELSEDSTDAVERSRRRASMPQDGVLLSSLAQPQRRSLQPGSGRQRRRCADEELGPDAVDDYGLEWPQSAGQEAEPRRSSSRADEEFELPPQPPSPLNAHPMPPCPLPQSLDAGAVGAFLFQNFAQLSARVITLEEELARERAERARDQEAVFRNLQHRLLRAEDRIRELEKERSCSTPSTVDH